MNRIFLLIPMMLITSFLQAQQQFTKEQQEVQQTVIRFFEALSNRDSVNLKNFAARDIALFEYGSIWNLDTLILKAITLNTATDFKRTNSFEFISTTINKTTAWTSYHLHSEMIRNGLKSTVQWLETVVAVKENKKWRIKVLHSTLIKRS